MHPVLLKIGPLILYSYGLMLALAYLCGIVWAIYMGKREGFREEVILDLCLVGLIASVIGARLAYIVFFWDSYRAHPWEALMIWKGGLVFQGGLVLAILAVWFEISRRKLPLLKLLDIAAPTTAIGYAIGRIGCFLNGCCYGIECDLPWAVRFPDLPGLRHPTQLYASIAGALMFLVLIYLWKHRKFEGQLLFSGLILYSVYRFLIEFIRTNPEYWFGLTQAQLASIPIFVISLIFYGILYKRAGRP